MWEEEDLTKLWILLAVSLALAWLIDNQDKALRSRGVERRERLFTTLLTIVLVFFCGLRIWGNDTSTYLEIYVHLTPTLDRITQANIPDFAEGFGFFFLTSLIKTLGFSTQDYLLFYAAITVPFYVLFVRHYSKSMVFGVFLMFTTGFYTFSMAAIKQTAATGICLLAVTAALERKWIRFFLLVGLASLFHPYAIIYLLVPLLMFKPWTARTFFYVIAFMAAGFLLENLLGVVLDITDMLGAKYDEESFVGEGVNIFRVAVSFVPLILAALYGKPLFKNSSRTDDLMFNMAMVNALIMFVGLFGTANYFARLANYFLPAQVIVLPWIIRRTDPRDRAILLPGCIVGYLGYFIYENAIIRPFDSGYAHISLWEYLSSHF